MNTPEIEEATLASHNNLYTSTKATIEVVESLEGKALIERKVAH